MPESHAKAYEIFKKTREERGLSLSDVANALHLTVTMIEQIEAGEFVHRHLAPVFMRGYIRSYGKYLDLSENVIDEIVSTLDVENPVKPAEKSNLTYLKQDKKKSAKQPSAHNSKKALSYLLVVALLIIIASFWHGANKPEVATPEPAAVIEQPENIMTPSEPEENAPLTSEEESPLAPEEASIPETPPPAVETPTPAPAVETPTPAPVVETPTPAPAVETPTPAPAVETPPLAPVVITPPPVKKAPPAAPTQPEVVDAEETL